MLKIIVYTRFKGQLQYLSNYPEGFKAGTELQLDVVSRGKPTFFTKNYNGSYVLICFKEITDTRIDSRTIPLVIAVIIDDRIRNQILRDEKSFMKVRTALYMMSHDNAVGLTDGFKNQKPMAFENWLKIYSNRDDVPPSANKPEPDDRKEDIYTVNKSVVVCLQHNHAVYMKDTQLPFLLKCLKNLPLTVASSITFSSPYGGTPAGECNLNLLSAGSDFEPNGNGFSFDIKRIHNIGDMSLDYEACRSADELSFLYDDPSYRDFFEQYSLDQILPKLAHANCLRQILNNSLEGKDITPCKKYLLQNREFFRELIIYMEDEGIPDELLNFLDENEEPAVSKERVKKKYTGFGEENKKNTASPPAGYHMLYKTDFQLLLYMTVFLASAAITGILHWHLFDFSASVKVVRIVFSAKPEDLVHFFLLQTMFVSFFELLKQFIYRGMKNGKTHRKNHDA